METEKLLLEYQKLVENVYQVEKLKCLSGLNNDYLLNGKPYLLWHNEVTRKCWTKRKGHFSYQKNLDDLHTCSHELLYFTALLYLYRPYINNPLKQSYEFSNRVIYSNFQNHYGKKYTVFIDIASQKAYNFWDRIGDLIASFFPENIKPHQVFFGTALDAVDSQFKSDENYIWLHNFRENDYKELNNIRKQVVHYTTSETDYKHEHLEKGTSNKEEMEKIQKQHESQPDYYKKQIELTIEGFERTLLLLEKVSAKLYSDII